MGLAALLYLRPELAHVGIVGTVILVAVVLAFLAFRFVAGVVKFVVIGAILLAIAYFVMKSGGAG